MQTKPTSEAYREGWDATFRRSTVEVNLRPGDTMSRLQVGGIVPKPREQYEREVEALEAQQSPEPPLPGADAAVCFDYRNHRGVLSFRRVVPIRLWHGNSIYHSGEQWFLQAFDLDKGGAQRDFAMKEIHHWGGAMTQAAPLLVTHYRTYPRGWRTVPPERRQWALVWYNGHPRTARFEPRWRMWVGETGWHMLIDTPWHPLPAPPDGSDVSAWCATETP